MPAWERFSGFHNAHKSVNQADSQRNPNDPKQKAARATQEEGILIKVTRFDLRQAKSYQFNTGCVELLSGKRFAPGEIIQLAPWGVEIIVNERLNPSGIIHYFSGSFCVAHTFPIAFDECSSKNPQDSLSDEGLGISALLMF